MKKVAGFQIVAVTIACFLMPLSRLGVFLYFPVQRLNGDLLIIYFLNKERNWKYTQKNLLHATDNLYLTMAKHNHTGHTGETIGANYLEETGYQVLEKNWRHSHWEVDIIACKNDTLHFIEIKTRRTKKFGLPEEKVRRKKIENLINAAEQYLYLQPQWKRIQFDILSILMLANEPIAYFFIEDVYL